MRLGADPAATVCDCKTCVTVVAKPVMLKSTSRLPTTAVRWSQLDSLVDHVLPTKTKKAETAQTLYRVPSTLYITGCSAIYTLLANNERAQPAGGADLSCVQNNVVPSRAAATFSLHQPSRVPALPPTPRDPDMSRASSLKQPNFLGSSMDTPSRSSTARRIATGLAAPVERRTLQRPGHITQQQQALLPGSRAWLRKRQRCTAKDKGTINERRSP